MIMVIDVTNLKRLIKLYKENSQISVREALKQSIADRIIIHPNFDWSIETAILYFEQQNIDSENVWF